MHRCLAVSLCLAAALTVAASRAAAAPGAPASRPSTMPGGARGRAMPPAAPLPAPDVAGGTEGDLVYATNMATLDTPRAGILGLRAIDIPRYTQTGPLPKPFPTRPTVILPKPHDPALPTIWTIGDSTVRCGINATGDDTVGQWGWGTPFVGYFDLKKVNVVNHALGGTTTASYYNGPWKEMAGQLKKGDLLLMQFGTNSGRGELPGIGEETQESPGRGGQTTTSYSFGHYLRQFIAEARAKGATPVVCSLIPRNSRGPDGKYVRSARTQAGWAKEVAAAEHADFIDLNELVARKYDGMSKEQVDGLFAGSPHTNWTGAVLNAETVISGLKALKSDPAAAYYLPQVSQIAPAPDLSR